MVGNGRNPNNKGSGHNNNNSHHHNKGHGRNQNNHNNNTRGHLGGTKTENHKQRTRSHHKQQCRGHHNYNTPSTPNPFHPPLAPHHQTRRDRHKQHNEWASLQRQQRPRILAYPQVGSY